MSADFVFDDDLPMDEGADEDAAEGAPGDEDENESLFDFDFEFPHVDEEPHVDDAEAPRVSTPPASDPSFAPSRRSRGSRGRGSQKKAS